jgi:hypothetical protein|tara:strand:- start:6083 stop:6484 length:402 start_codon:yes stop_codon:yes gene_type:complete
MSNDLEIFNGKSFSDLTKDIYDNSKNKRLQLDLLMQEVHGFITSIDDAVVLAPIVKELFDVSVKNDEHLVKLASVLQRVIVKSVGGSAEDSIGLTDQEKEELIETLQSTATVMQQETDRLSDIKEAKMKITES